MLNVMRQPANDYVKLLGVLQKDDVKKNFFKNNSSGYDYYGQLANCYTNLGIADSAFFFLQKMKWCVNEQLRF